MLPEYQSRENAKHVLRAMKENARQGNGSRLPLGFTLQKVEKKRGHCTKKRIVVDAEIIRPMFDRIATRIRAEEGKLVGYLGGINHDLATSINTRDVSSRELRVRCSNADDRGCCGVSKSRLSVEVRPQRNGSVVDPREVRCQAALVESTARLNSNFNRAIWSRTQRQISVDVIHS